MGRGSSASLKKDKEKEESSSELLYLVVGCPIVLLVWIGHGEYAQEHVCSVGATEVQGTLLPTTNVLTVDKLSTLEPSSGGTLCNLPMGKQCKFRYSEIYSSPSFFW